MNGQREPTISREELLDVLTRGAREMGMTDSAESSWLTGVRRVLDTVDDGGEVIDLSEAGLLRQEAALERLPLTNKTRDNYLSAWRRARELALGYVRAQADADEETFWDQLRRRSLRRVQRRRAGSSPTPLSGALHRAGAVSSSREVRLHHPYISGVGELMLQLPDHLSTGEASELVQYILEQIAGTDTAEE